MIQITAEIKEIENRKTIKSMKTKADHLKRSTNLTDF